MNGPAAKNNRGASLRELNYTITETVPRMPNSDFP